MIDSFGLIFFCISSIKVSKLFAVVAFAVYQRVKKTSSLHILCVHIYTLAHYKWTVLLKTQLIPATTNHTRTCYSYIIFEWFNIIFSKLIFLCKRVTFLLYGSVHTMIKNKVHYFWYSDSTRWMNTFSGARKLKFSSINIILHLQIIFLRSFIIKSL